MMKYYNSAVFRFVYYFYFYHTAINNDKLALMSLGTA